MTAKIIDGREATEAIEREIASEVAQLMSEGRRCKLVAVQVGESPSSRLYTRMQERRCKRVDIDYELVNLPEDTTHKQLSARIEQLNGDETISGLILQMPLPEHLEARKIQTMIAPEKDPESLHPSNMGRLFFEDYVIAPCTPMAVVALLERACEDLAGKDLVIVGRSEIFGKPLALMLLAFGRTAPTVTVCHTVTQDLIAQTSRAEVLIVAGGASQRRWGRYERQRRDGQDSPPPDLSPLIKPEHLREGAVVIDVAVNRIPKGLDETGAPLTDENGKTAMITVGDVDFEGALEKVAAITPVPGGVGPVTVAMLLKNTVTCAKLQR